MEINMTELNITNLTKAILVLMITIIWSFTPFNNAQAQSFGDLKKFKNLIEKEVTTEKTKKKKSSNRSNPLNDMQNNANLTTLNENQNSKYCFDGNETFDGKKEAQYKVCIPEKTLNSEKHYIVKNISLNLVDFIEDSSCTMGNRIPTYDDFEVRFHLYCMYLNKTKFELNVQTTKDAYFISRAKINVCGPKISTHKGAFTNKLIKKYGTPNKPNMAMFAKAKKPFKIKSYKFKDKTAHGYLIINKTPRGSSQDINYNSACYTKTGTLWGFRVQSKEDGKYSDHLNDLKLGQQSEGDDF